MQFLTIISECGIVNGLLMLSVGRNIEKLMLCGGVIHMETEQPESDQAADKLLAQRQKHFPRK